MEEIDTLQIEVRFEARRRMDDVEMACLAPRKLFPDCVLGRAVEILTAERASKRRDAVRSEVHDEVDVE